MRAFPGGWKMAKVVLGEVAGWGVAAELASPESHSWMVTILRGGRCRCVSRAFFRWWKSPSVSVYRRPLSCVLRLCSNSAASLKETRRPVELVDRKRSVSASWLSGSSPRKSGFAQHAPGPTYAWALRKQR